ncbi:MAG: AMP-binding protein, partial [Candidatus Bathyarchaeia archaeon]
MPLEYKTYKEAEERFTWSQVWDLFDGNRESFNIAHECVDRHAHRRKTALRVKFDDGHSEFHDFGELARSSSQFANMLQRHGVNTGDRVAIILNPSFEFYTTLFGTIKRGAAAVPCSPLFGPDALEYRIQHSGARALVTTQEKAEQLSTTPVANVFIVGEMFHELLSEEDEEYQVHTSADDVVVIQYTSGTTAKPKDVIYHHKSVPVSMPSAIFGLGLAEGEEFFCPSSPAWGHGIWYGTIAPLALGIAVGAYSGKFETELLLEALEEFKITNLSAAPTVY